MDGDRAQTAGNDKFSYLISMHMPLIDSWLPVMMHRVSDGVARSTRPWKSFDVDAFFVVVVVVGVVVWNVYRRFPHPF